MNRAGWATSRLGDIATINMGQSPPSSTINEDGHGLAFVQGNAEFGPRNPQPVKFCTQPQKQAQVGDILLSVRAPVGALNLADRPICIGRGLSAITATGVDAVFLWHALRRVVSDLDRVSQGSTFAAINKADLSRLTIRLGSLGEQRKIAAILSSVDDAIEKTQAVIDQVQVVKRGLTRELLTWGLPGRHTRLKQTPIGSVPEEWQVLPVIEVLSAKPRNGRSPRARSKPPGVATFSIAAVRDGQVDIFSNLKYVDLTEEEAKPFRVHHGDMLVVRGNANEALLGRCGSVTTFPPGCIYPDLLMRLTPNESADPRWLAYLWNSDMVHNQLRAKAKTTSGTLKVNQHDVSTVLLPRPNLEEQLEIVRIAEALDSSYSMNRDVLAAYRHFRENLMSVLLTGELRVTPDPATI